MHPQWQERERTNLLVQMPSEPTERLFGLMNVLTVAKHLVLRVDGLTTIVRMLPLHSNVLNNRTIIVPVVASEVEVQNTHIGKWMNGSNELGLASLVDGQDKLLHAASRFDRGKVEILMVNVALDVSWMTLSRTAANHHQLANVNWRSEARRYEQLVVCITQ